MILENSFTNAFDAVQALRSNWLRPRGTEGFTEQKQILVYYDTTLLGGVESLRAVTPAMVAYIEWFSGTEATRRWGMDHGQGVIFVSSQR